MSYKFVLVLLVILLTGCNATNELEPISKIKPGVATEGSLANHKLIGDATKAIELNLGFPISGSDVLKFIIQQPVGDEGSRSWREMWIVKSADGGTQFIMTFKEAGLGAADFEIKKMGN